MDKIEKSVQFSSTAAYFKFKKWTSIKCYQVSYVKCWYSYKKKNINNKKTQSELVVK